MSDQPSLIMITQRMFYDDPFFGYNVKLVESLASKLETLYVLPLYGEEMTHLSNVEVIPFGTSSDESRFVKFFRLQKTFLGVTRNNEIDGVFIHQNQLYAPALAWTRLYYRGPFVLFKAHGQLPWNVRLALPFIDTVLTSAEEGFDYPTEKKRIIGQSIDMDLFDRKTFPSEPPFRIISVGRISPIKGYEDLIEAVARLNRNADRPVELTIVGEPARSDDQQYQSNLEKQVRERGLEDRVTFTGGVKYEAIPDQLAEHHLFVNSSVGESALDKVVLEAMACGRPVITTNPNFRPLLAEDFPETLAERGNPEKLAESIQYWMDQPRETREQVGQKLRALVEKNHSMDHFTDEIIRACSR